MEATNNDLQNQVDRLHAMVTGLFDMLSYLIERETGDRIAVKVEYGDDKYVWLQSSDRAVRTTTPRLEPSHLPDVGPEPRRTSSEGSPLQTDSLKA